MTERKTILVVDDSPNEIRILMENLKTDYAVLTATSGESAITIVNKTTPDLVLLDVNMAPMNGYEACSILLQTHPDMPIVFVSANTQTEEILKGFDVGGRDYITKPVDPEVMKSKVSVLLKQIDQEHRLDTEIHEASDLAKAALSSASDLNIILNFLKVAAKTTDPDHLVKQIGTACQEFNLSVSIQLRSINNKSCHYTSCASMSAVERDILKSSSNMNGRFLERGKRLIINGGSISMLVKNMPDSSSDRYTELKDYLLVLCQSAHEINEKLKADQSIAEQRIAMVLEAVKDANDTLGSIQQFQSNYKEESIRLMDELLEEIEANFFNMGLTESQEQAISSIIQRKLNEGVEHMEAGLKMDEKLKRLMHNLNELTGSL